MKPVYETERRASRPWLLPLIVGTLAFVMLLAMAGITGIRHALARQGTTAPPEIAPRTPVASPDRTSLIDDTAVRIAGLQKWEYKITGAGAASMNKAGAEGWELVSVCTLGAGRTSAYFKRPLREATPVTPAEPEAKEDASDALGPQPTAPGSTPRVPPSLPESDKRLLPPYVDPKQ